MVTLFLYSLAGGMLVVVATGRMDQLAWRFLRVIGVVVFAIVCGVTAWHLARSSLDRVPGGGWAVGIGSGSGVGAAAIIFMAPLAKRFPRLVRAICGLGGLAGVSAAALIAVVDSGIDTRHSLLTSMVVIGQASGAFLLGSITVAWLLGHAYLTATKMTIAPLVHFSRTLSWAVVIRIVFLIVSLTISLLVESEPQASLLSQLGQAWLVLLLRVGVGLVAVGAFAYMVSDCVRRRATQSATGILYFGSIFAYIGELASQHLLADYGWPL